MKSWDALQEHLEYLRYIKIEGEKMTYKEAVFELWCWQYSNTNSFNQQIFSLFHKADEANLLRLSLAFPELFAAWKEWYHSPTSDEFFERYRETMKQIEGEVHTPNCIAITYDIYPSRTTHMCVDGCPLKE